MNAQRHLSCVRDLKIQSSTAKESTRSVLVGSTTLNEGSPPLAATRRPPYCWSYAASFGPVSLLWYACPCAVFLFATRNSAFA